MVTKVYLIRHCEAEGNLHHVFQGSSDCDITEKGRAQLEKLAVRMKDVSLEAIYASPKKRAKSTAEAVNRYHHLSIHIDENLTEIHGGEMEGKRWEDLRQQCPDLMEKWTNRPWEFEAPGGESMEEVYARMAKTVCRIAEENRGRTIALCSHGCAIKNFLCYASHKPLREILSMGWAENTAVSLVEFDEQMNTRVVFQNDVSHLPPELYSMKLQTFWRNA